MYGDWLILGAAAGLVSLADLGTQMYFGNAYQAAFAVGDAPRFQRLLQTAMACRFALAGIAALAVLPAVLLLDTHATFGLTALAGGEAAAVLAIVALDTIINFPKDSVSQIYRAKGEYARMTLLAALPVVGKIGVVGGAMVLQSTPTVVAVGLVLTSIVLGWGVMLFDMRRYPDVKLGLALPCRREIAEIVATSKWYALSWAGGILSLQFPVMVIGALVGVGPVVVGFAASRTLVNVARQVPTYLALSSGVELAHLHYSGMKQPLAALFMATGRLCCAFSGLVGGAILGFSAPVLALWTGNPTLHDQALLVILVVPLLLTAPALPARMLVFLGNRAREEGYGAGLQLLLLLPLVLGLTAVAGVYGTAIALAVSEGVGLGVYLLRAGLRVAGIALGEYLRRCLPLLAISFGLSWGAALLIDEVTDTTGLAGLVVAAGIWTLLVPAQILLVASPARVRQQLWSLVRQPFTRRRGNR